MVTHHARASGRQNDVRGWGSNRVSSSRGAKLYFGAVFVFVCFVCVFHLCFYFQGTFSDFSISSVFCVLQKACLTSSLHFFNWFLSTSNFTVGFFWGTFSDFSLGSIFCVLQKACLTSRLHFFQLIFKDNFLYWVLADRSESCFKRRELWYEVQHLRGGKG